MAPASSRPQRVNLADMISGLAERARAESSKPMTSEDTINGYVTDARLKLDFAHELLKRASAVKEAMDGSNVHAFLAAVDHYAAFEYDDFVAERERPIEHADEDANANANKEKGADNV